jgi:hypothetical protein
MLQRNIAFSHVACGEMTESAGFKLRPNYNETPGNPVIKH